MNSVCVLLKEFFSDGKFCFCDSRDLVSFPLNSEMTTTIVFWVNMVKLYHYHTKLVMMFTLNWQQTQNIIGKCSPDDSVILWKELEGVSDMLDPIRDNALRWVEHVEGVLR